MILETFQQDSRHDATDFNAEIATVVRDGSTSADCEVLSKPVTMMSFGIESPFFSVPIKCMAR